MKIETVEVAAYPIVYVSRTSPMNPQEIGRVMGEAFGTLGGFIGSAGITPAGPPLAIYHSLEGDKISFDVAMPVSAPDIEKVGGEIKAGESPACRALKTVHKGAYAKLRDTYGELEAEMSKAGMKRPSFAWEVYLNDPDKTPEDDLLTEIYMPID